LRNIEALHSIALVLLLLAVAVPTGLWLVSFAAPAWYSRTIQRVGSRLDSMAKWRRTMLISAVVAVLGTRLLLLPIWPVPQPGVLDEFSYLLMGDTFASGRLANPPHAMWQHFETLFVLQQPTYASVYPVMQGLFLALGQLVFGNPWWGVWLSVGAMSGALTWAIQGWLRGRWVIFATVWIAFQLALTTYWMNSYWGGAPSALGGALVAGSIARMRTRLRTGDFCIFGLGLAVLANSRPYEGVLLGCMTGAWVIWQVHHRCAHWGEAARLFAPVAFILASTAVCMGIYCYHVTGSPWKFPYQSYFEQYAATPAFVWQSVPRLPVYHHEVLRQAHLSLISDYKQFETLSGALRFTLYKLRLLGTFYLGPLVFVPVLTIPGLLRGRFRLPFLTLLVVLIGILGAVFIQPHYGAPVTAFLAILSVQALRILWLSRRFGNPLGTFLVPVAPILCSAYIVLSATAVQPQHLMRARPAIIRALSGKSGSHLVIVRYGAEHALLNEWVYNAADIDGSPIVWARDMGDARNAELLRYYPNRQAWLLLPDETVVELMPYNPGK
jgi:hypothetical protein